MLLSLSERGLFRFQGGSWGTQPAAETLVEILFLLSHYLLPPPNLGCPLSSHPCTEQRPWMGSGRSPAPSEGRSHR